jgi:hypothetical protein
MGQHHTSLQHTLPPSLLPIFHSIIYICRTDTTVHCISYLYRQNDFPSSFVVYLYYANGVIWSIDVACHPQLKIQNAGLMIRSHKTLSTASPT